MGDKKRKEAPQGAAELPKKKSRKSTDSGLTTAISANTETTKARTEPKKKTSKKSKRNGNTGETLTADGINGVVEHAGDENIGAKSSSMLAQAQYTIDEEMKEEFDPAKDDTAPEDDDLGAALLAGFDSDTSDHAEDEGLDVKNLGSIPNYKKTKKKLRKIEKNGGADKPGAIYVGRIPHGFYEPQMREYFSQFGDITRLRLSRNKRTGASKHFAFIEFKSEEVAKIGAETMDNYLMFGHILKCKFAPAESLHADVWKGANKKFRKIPHEKLEKAKLEAPRSADKWRRKNEKEEKKRQEKAKKLKEKMGYDAPQVELTDPMKALKANQLEIDKPKNIDEAVMEDALTMAAIEAPPTASKEGGATESREKLSKSKKDTKSEGETAIKGKSRAVEVPIQVADGIAADAADDWEDNCDPDDSGPEDESAPQPKAEAESTPGSLPVFTTPRIPKDATGKKTHRDANGKYTPPLQRKQLAQAKFAKDHPEAHRAAKQAKVSERKQKRAEKKDKRHQKLVEKFGASNFKGGSNPKSQKSKVKGKVGGRNE